MSEFDGRVTFEVDGTPGTVNDGASKRGRHWATQRKEKQDWEAVFGYSVMKARLPRHLSFVKVNVELQFIDPGRGRDTENYRGPISKPLADVLQKGGWLENDTDEEYILERVRISDVKLERTPAQKTMGLRSKMVVTIDYRLDPAHHAPLGAGGTEAGGGAAGSGVLGPEARG